MKIRAKLNRILCTALTLILLCACTSNGESDISSDTEKSESIAAKQYSICLPFSKKDSLNPYKAETKQNKELSMLLFDPLIKINSSFDAELYIADSYEYLNKKCTVKLKNIYFTDGSELTADDVIYSFKAAKESNAYSKQLKAVTASSADGKTVVFSLSYNDPNMINLLDFPIIKAGTANLTDENNRAVPPIGCGRYYFEDTNALSLTANNGYYGKAINARSITLVDCPDDDSLSHYAASGSISAIYSDMSDNTVPKKSGEYIKVPTTHLVFIGVNCYKDALSDAVIRLAISSAADRTALCNDGYYGYADPASNVFSPNWSLSKTLQSVNVTQNIEQTVAYLGTIGYNVTDSDGFVVNDSGQRLTFSLMYNKENSARAAAVGCIATQLKKCGIEITPVGIDYSTYRQRLADGDYELYIGEIKLGKSFYLGDILSSAVIAGYPSESTAAAMFNQYYSGETEIESALSAFAAEMPFIPLCYRKGVTVVTDRLTDCMNVSISDVYNGIEGFIQQG